MYKHHYYNRVLYTCIGNILKVMHKKNSGKIKDTKTKTCLYMIDAEIEPNSLQLKLCFQSCMLPQIPFFQAFKNMNIDWFSAFYFLKENL